MPSTHARPRMLFAGKNGDIYDDPDLLMLCRKGREWTLPRPDELIPLPGESELLLLPGRLAVGLDPESGETLWVDTGRKSVRRIADARFAEHEREIDRTLQRYGVDVASLTTGEDFVPPLKNLLAKRS